MTDTKRVDDPETSAGLTGSEIAIIGMACRFPGADTPEAFWEILRGGLEPLTVLTDAQLAAAGVPPEQYRDPAYVRRMPVIEGIEDFDARFFGYTPLEATIMDPQHRLFLECAWESFERAGYNPEEHPRPVGVFTGAKTNTYLFNVVAQRARFPTLDNFQIALGNDLAAMATRVSYKLNLRGPSYALHTACSTSLVAVHLACQSLLLDECAMAVAGGAAINVPQERGYLYTKGGILSPDGSCHTFAKSAAGSNFGNGVGALLLKRLSDALEDGDRIHAVIRGSATNNDGAAKASFTAPGAAGQTAVLLEAMAVAGVDAEELGYLEAHGTATDLGDSIEMLALNQAFRASTAKKGFCAVGSVKTNLGHLETVAGVAGLIKTALALEHRELPPSLHFDAPSEKIEIEGGPFYVNTELKPWQPTVAGGKRLAGVSSFGIGSTNAHVIVEEAPVPRAVDADRPWQLVMLSAQTPTALERMASNLAGHLDAHAEGGLADVAFTLAVGRKAFAERGIVVARDRADAVEALGQPERFLTRSTPQAERKVAFLLPGLGEHFVDMGLGLYQNEPVFRAAVDRSCALLEPHLGLDLRTVIYPRGTDVPAVDEAPREGKTDLRALLGRPPAPSEADARLSRTLYAQPALFVIEHALAELLAARGIKPSALLGYSLGEYVAACLAGVFSLEDALALVAHRARLIDGLEGGGMLAVALAEDAVLPWLERHGLALAAVNGAAGTVAAGPVAAIEALAAALAAEGIPSRPLATTHAFHAPGMAPIADELTRFVGTLKLAKPTVPLVSNVTGTWMSDEEATDPGYWARHLLGTVRFAEGVAAIAERSSAALLEVGPGASLASFARLEPACGKDRPVVTTMRARHEKTADRAAFLLALGRLWQGGVRLAGAKLFEGERRRRVTLPTYPFERQRCWLDPTPEALTLMTGETVVARPSVDAEAALTRIDDPGRWLYEPRWEATARAAGTAAKLDGSWLLLVDEGAAVDGLVASLRQAGAARVALAVAGESFARLSRDGGGTDRYRLRPAEEADYRAVFADLGPTRVLHLWQLGAAPESSPAAFEATQERGLWSLVALAKAGATRVAVAASGLEAIGADDLVVPERAPLAAALVVIPQEQPQLALSLLDVGPATSPDAGAQALVAWLADGDAEPYEAVRHEKRFLRRFEVRPLPAVDGATQLRQGGVYLLLGGLGGIGVELALHLWRTQGARLTLTRRTPLPPRESWADLLAGGDALEARTRRALETVLELERAGAEVLCLAVDVADEAALAAAIAATRERFGALHGVFQAAGVLAADAFEPVRRLGRASAQRHFVPKVHGLYALERCLAVVPELDFCLLFSSISAYLGGGLGSLAYAAANAFVESFGARRQQRPAGSAWLAVAWDSWRERGEAVPDDAAGFGATLARLAMAPEEGIEVLERLLASPAPARRPIVSTGDLEARWQQWVLGPRRASALLAGSAAADGRAPSAGKAGRAQASGDELERQIAAIWGRVLGRTDIARDENFFDLGGNSLLGLQLVAEISRELGVEVEPVTLFEAPTVAAMARHLAPPASATAAAPRSRKRATSSDIAIIGMAGRFPGADSIEELWRVFAEGRETIRFFTREELLAAGVAPQTLADPNFVPAHPVLSEVECFDAPFFGYSPREAEVMDPQQRVFLETSWQAFEDAGYDIEKYDGLVGVYAGASISSYMANLYSNPDLVESVGTFQTMVGNDKDSLTTRVSYNFNLRGPSMAVQTFCSTSLVAVHLGCRALLDGECDMALAGGITIVVPQVAGYRFEDGGIGSRDGHIHTFDAKASGIVFGNGLGVVVLKRLEDALADGDPIRAVIKASAVNNDGSVKAGYTATSVEGQSQVVLMALEAAGVDPSTIRYMEAHGTGTPLGDPIEMAAMTKAYRQYTDEKRFCFIGSAKTNLGHLDRAAGVTGLIKAVLTLENELIPPSLNFVDPNPVIDFENSAFEVVTEARPWLRGKEPRRAAVNSLGLGGTNAHAILEEAPVVAPSDPGKPWQLLPLSAASETALAERTRQLAAHLRAHPEQPLADIAYTLQVGRKALAHRRFLVVADGAHGEAAEVLEAGDAARLAGGKAAGEVPGVVFLFPGLGGQYRGMARGLYASEPVFRAAFDRVAELLVPELGLDLRPLLFGEAPSAEAEPAGGKLDLKRMLGRSQPPEDPAERELARTAIAQPALFAVQVALAALVESWGLRPKAMVGYSLGEYVAATVGGLFELEAAVRLVARRALLIETLEAGAMLAVPLAEAELGPWLGPDVSLAAVNGPQQCVLAGPVPAIAALEARLGEAGHASRRLATTHAFHSSMMERLLEPFRAELASLATRQPTVPWLSNVTGAWMSAEDAASPDYWARHLVSPVRFDRALEVLGEQAGETVFLELGPGTTLGALLHQHPAFAGRRPRIVSALRHGYENRPDGAHLLESVGRLWLAGVEVTWPELHRLSLDVTPRRLRQRLPTYRFDRHVYWVESAAASYTEAVRALALAGSARTEGAACLQPGWRREPAARLPVELPDGAPERWLVLADAGGIGAALAAKLEAYGCEVATAQVGEAFAEVAKGRFVVRPNELGDYRQLLAELGTTPDGIVHLWGLDASAELAAARPLVLGSVLELARALPPEAGSALWLVSAGACEVAGEAVEPARALVGAALAVLPAEWPERSLRAIDVRPAVGHGGVERLAGELAAEILAAGNARRVALRGAHRFRAELVVAPTGPLPVRAGGVYVVTGGLASRGYLFAEFLARRADGAKLVLTVAPGEVAVHGGRNPRRQAALEALGAEVVVLEVGAGGEAAAVALARERFGKLHGVVHAAEPADVEAAYVMVAEAADARQAEAGERLFAVRAGGAGALVAALATEVRAGHEPDFVLLLSSVGAVAPAVGLLYEAAAGAFCDGLAEAGALPGLASVAWDFWAHETNDVPTHAGERNAPAAGAACSVLPLPPSGVAASCEAVLEAVFRALPATRLVASARDLGAFNEVAVARASEGAAVRATGGSYARPELSTPYVAPRTETERKIAEIWQQMLGVAEIGVHDGFLELGGDSLLAARLVSRLREVFETEVPVRLFFEASTVAALAGEVDALLATRQAVQDQDLSELLGMLEGLSDEEVEAELARRLAGSDALAEVGR